MPFVRWKVCGSIVCIAFAPIAAAQPRSRSMAILDAPQQPVVQVVTLPDGAMVHSAAPGQGTVDLGRISWAGRARSLGTNHRKERDSFTVATRFGLRLDCGVADFGRRGAVSAFLRESDFLYATVLDRVKLSLAPAVIAPAMACGSATEHLVEITVPVAAPPGTLNTNIGFSVSLK